MPRPKERIRLTVDEIKRWLKGENGEIAKKMRAYWRAELKRRQLAGKAGGRPKREER
jgi:hypothetical protein